MAWCQKIHDLNKCPPPPPPPQKKKVTVNSIELLRINLTEISFQIHNFSIIKMHLKIVSAKWWPFCLGGCLNIKVLSYQHRNSHFKDELVSRPSYLYDGNPYTWKDVLYIETGASPQCVNTLRPRQNGRHFPDNSFKCIFMNKNVCISIRISLRFVPKGPINNIPALVQIMARRRPGDKQLFEPMMVSLLTHICVTRPQWVNCRSEWDNISGAILMVIHLISTANKTPIALLNA